MFGKYPQRESNNQIDRLRTAIIDLNLLLNSDDTVIVLAPSAFKRVRDIFAEWSKANAAVVLSDDEIARMEDVVSFLGVKFINRLSLVPDHPRERRGRKKAALPGALGTKEALDV